MQHTPKLMHLIKLQCLLVFLDKFLANLKAKLLKGNVQHLPTSNSCLHIWTSQHILFKNNLNNTTKFN